MLLLVEMLRWDNLNFGQAAYSLLVYNKSPSPPVNHVLKYKTTKLGTTTHTELNVFTVISFC